MPKKYILILVFVIALASGAYFYLSQQGFIPENWSKEEVKTRGNESLLFGIGARVELYKESSGRYPENLDELIEAE